MKRFLFGLLLFAGTGFAAETPALLTQTVDRAESLTLRARARQADLSAANVKALERLAAGSDPAVRLWAERERKVHATTPFCNLARPKDLAGYPAELETLSTGLRAELTTFLEQLRKEKTKLLEEAEKAFDERVRNLVRANDTETAAREREAFRGFAAHKSVKALEREIQQVERLLAGKSQGHLWRRAKDDATPAPQDALFLFEPENPAFQEFVKNVRVVSRGSPRRGPSGAAVGTRVRVNGKRGLSMLALVGNEVLVNAHYDTYESKTEGMRMVEDVKSLPYGAFVVVFAHDDATRRFPGEAQSTLFRLGASQGLMDRPYRSAYVLIGVKGLRPGGAVEILDAEQLQFPPQ